MHSDPHFEQNGQSDELVIVLHGYSKATDRMAAVRETIKDVRPNADIYAPRLPFIRGKGICLQKAETIVAGLMKKIELFVTERANSGHGYESVTFVGHSFGAVLARRLAITTFGEQKSPTGDRPAPFEQELAQFSEARPWAGLIKRIVLLAGMTRGWTVSSTLDWITSVRWSVAQFFGETILCGKPTLFAIRRGAPFLAQTRLQWLALMNPNYGPRPNIVTVQLLGSADDQVSPDDNVDYAVDLFGAYGGTSYFYIEVPFSNHPDVIDMAKSGWAKTQAERDVRRKKFTFALTASRAQLASECVTRDQMADNLPPEPDPTVTDVVFVVHGIRDKGYWTQKVARTIKKHATKDQKFKSWTESYGYFAMLPFILRSVRQRKVEWLMDRYTEARALYPRALFHYVGHSNGTYLAAQALHDYPAARFKRIVFAGSVVRRDYDWLKLIRRNPAAPQDAPRVSKVLNYVATRDWVVALFPKALQRLWRGANLGSAGHDGFLQASADGPVHEVKYIVGNHGAGHEETNWDDIAQFIVSGQPPAQSYPPFAKIQSRFLRAVGYFSFIIFPFTVALVIGLGILILWSIFAKLPCSAIPYFRDMSWSVCNASPIGNQQAWRTLGFFIYLWIIYLFVTRF